jgi:hypothetical protein
MKSQSYPRVQPRRFAGVAAAAALLVAGCVGATASGSVSPLPAAGTGSTSSTAARGESPSAWPTFVFPTQATDAPATAVDPLPSVPAAPAGTWNSIRWTALPATSDFGARTPFATTDPVTGMSTGDGATFQVFGWSRGYIGFTITPQQQTSTIDPATGDYSWSPPTLSSSYSADGVHWHVGQKLDPAAAGSQYLNAMRTVLEGPTGLLAVGWTEPCGSQYVDSLWTSTDGISWLPVNAGKAFGGEAVNRISGGPAGYVAVAYRSAGVWTSTDGRSWQRVALNAGPFKNALVNDGTAMAGGFVLAGTAGTRDCNVTTYAGSPPPPVSRTASVWWSADSSNWTRVSLPGAVASTDYQDTWVCPLSDQSVVVVNDIWGDSGPSQRAAWVTKDGRSYSVVHLPRDFDEPDIISVGGHNLIVEGATGSNDIGDPMAVSGQLRLRTIDDNFAMVSVAQTGTVPELLYSNSDYPYGMVAIGPTGVVVTSVDGSQLWFGTPSAQ